MCIRHLHKNDEQGKAESTNNFIGKHSVSGTAKRNHQKMKTLKCRASTHNIYKSNRHCIKVKHRRSSLFLLSAKNPKLSDLISLKDIRKIF